MSEKPRNAIPQPFRDRLLALQGPILIFHMSRSLYPSPHKPNSADIVAVSISLPRLEVGGFSKTDLSVAIGFTKLVETLLNLFDAKKRAHQINVALRARSEVSSSCWRKPIE